MSTTDELKIPRRTTKDLVVMLQKDLLQQLYRPSPQADKDIQLNTKIEQAWQEQFRKPFFHTPPSPTSLRGHPGMGKTTSFKVAAKDVARWLGLDYVHNPTDDYEPTGNELLFQQIELGGETSNYKITGIPHIKDIFRESEGASEKYTTTAPPKSLTNLRHAGASVLLLDDFQNASPSVQNVCLSVLEEKRYQAMDFGPHTYVGSTGNLGAADGTNIATTSTATTSRGQTFIAYDTPENFIERTITQYPDQFADAHLGAFFDTYPDCFHTPSKSKKGEPFACPRTWSKLLPYLRHGFADFEYMLEQATNPSENLFDMKEVITRAEGQVGLEVSSKLKQFYLSLTNFVAPIAKKAIAGTELNQREIDVLAEKMGNVGNKGEFFSGQLTRRLGEVLAVEISNQYKADPKNWLQNSQQSIKNFVNFTFETFAPADSSKIPLALTSLAARLSVLVNDPAVAQFGKGVATPQMAPDLCMAIQKHIVHTPKAKLEIAGVPLYKTVGSDVLSNIGQYESTADKLQGITNIIDNNEAFSSISEKATKKPEQESQTSLTMGMGSF